MRKVYYVPSHLDPEDYRSEWYGNTAEVHNSVSESNKDYILKGEDYPQWIQIPELTMGMAPERTPANRAISFWLIDEFYMNDEEKKYTVQIWEYDLESDSKPTLFKTLKMEYERQKQQFYTKHIDLPIGWYKLEWYRNDEIIDDKAISVFEEHDDHEVPVSDGAM